MKKKHIAFVIRFGLTNMSSDITQCPSKHRKETRQNARWFSSSVAATKAMAAKATVAESGTTNAAADTVAMERLQVIY